MDYRELKMLWKKEEEKSFRGWDFSHLKNRWKDEKLPWDYENILREHLKPNHNILDMGTGGGEFLLSLNHPHRKTSVTEMWEPNVKLCRKKLEPLGIVVKQVFNDEKLPFEDNVFDMIINRHESYDVKEVKRILKPDGIFISQQVGGKNNEILSKRLIKDFEAQFKDINLKNTLKKFKKHSFDILYADEYFPYLRFYDIGAIVYFAKVVEWEFPNFSVNSCFLELCKLHHELMNKDYIESFEHRYIITCKNMK